MVSEETQMGETITLELPEETLERYRRGAALASKGLEEFLTDRIVTTAPPFLDDLSPSTREEMRALMELSDEELWDVARAKLPPARQRVYTRLLNKNSEGTITEREREKMHAIGDEARRLTLRKARAYVLLRWRGFRIPTREELLRGE